MGLARRILDTIFFELKTMKLTHEVLVTFMAEVPAIINARPLIPVSTDPTDSIVLSPAIVLSSHGKSTLCQLLTEGDFVVSDLY